MLLQIKGRTHVQTRLVEPNYKSINRGDCFILLAEGKQLFRYVGAFANVIEIARSKKICAYIVENKDLGCSATAEIVLNESGVRSSEHQFKKFWNLLGKPEDYEVPECGHSEEDDLIEEDDDGDEEDTNSSSEHRREPQPPAPKLRFAC